MKVIPGFRMEFDDRGCGVLGRQRHCACPGKPSEYGSGLQDLRQHLFIPSVHSCRLSFRKGTVLRLIISYRTSSTWGLLGICSCAGHLEMCEVEELQLQGAPLCVNTCPLDPKP